SATLQELFDKWEKEFAKPRYTAKTLRTDKSRFDTCFDDLKQRKIATIHEHDVRKKHTDLASSRGQVTANRAIQLLRRMFNFGRLKPNPASNREGKVVISSSSVDAAAVALMAAGAMKPKDEVNTTAPKPAKRVRKQKPPKAVDKQHVAKAVSRPVTS